MHPKYLGGIAHVALRALQRPRNEHLLELAAGVVVEHAPIEHFEDELFELIAHGWLLQLAA